MRRHSPHTDDVEELVASTKSQPDPADLDDIEAELEAAEAAAAQSRAAVRDTEDQVVAGEEITAETLAGVHSTARWDALKAQGLRSKYAQHKAAGHRAACQHEADQVAALAQEPAVLADKLRTITELVRDYYAGCDDHNRRLALKQETVRTLLPDEHTGPHAPPASSARLGWTGRDIILGRRRMRPIDAGLWLSGALAPIVATRGGFSVVPRRDGQDAADLLARHHDEQPSTPGLTYYAGENGQVIGINRPLTPIETRNLRPLTAAEAANYLGGSAA
jgi:hypothetical protein